MELHCNLLECRKALTTVAVVTTCSHIFCPECAQSSFGSPPSGRESLLSHALQCPACDTLLVNRDDIVTNELQPSEGGVMWDSTGSHLLIASHVYKYYKSSIMAGLSPEIIMDIAGRALNFWTYQVTQEAHYHDILLKTAQEKCQELERHAQSLRREAEDQLGGLQSKLERVRLEADEERRRAGEVSEQLSDKTRQFLKLQQMYDKIKRKMVLLTPPGGGGSGMAISNGASTLPGGFAPPLTTGRNYAGSGLSSSSASASNAPFHYQSQRQPQHAQSFSLRKSASDIFPLEQHIPYRQKHSSNNPMGSASANPSFGMWSAESRRASVTHHLFATSPSRASNDRGHRRAMDTGTLSPASPSPSNFTSRLGAWQGRDGDPGLTMRQGADGRRLSRA